ncbi:MAG: hypothetical protein ACRCZE_03630 [Candidatus Altimarinota bacterium]
MQKLAFKIGFIAILANLILGFSMPFALAQENTETPPTEQTFDPKDLFRKFNYTNQPNGNTGTKIGAVAALPDKPWNVALAEIIKIMLNITGAVALVSFTAGGVMMVVSNGNQDTLDRGKKVIIYSIAGLVVVAVSYALVIGVSELQFFTPGTASNDPSGTTTTGTTDSGSNTQSPGGSSSGSTDAGS